MSWYKVSQAASLNNNGLAKVNINGQEILIMKIAGHFYATSCYCTHEGYDLSEGFVDGAKLICPDHFATYEPSDGSVISTPTDAGDIPPLKSYRVKLENDEIFVEL